MKFIYFLMIFHFFQLSSSSVLASQIQKACEILKNPQTHEYFKGVRESLCENNFPNCVDKSETECESSNVCHTLRGSGSGPNCNPCTPDMVFWSCESSKPEDLAATIIRYKHCLSIPGKWITINNRAPIFGTCVTPLSSVTGTITPESKDLALYFNGKEVKNIINNGNFSLSLDADVSAQLKVVNLKTKKSVVKTVRPHPNERLHLIFEF